MNAQVSEDRLPVPAAVTEVVGNVVATALEYAEIAEGFTIVTNEDAQLAGEQLRGLASFRKAYEAKRLEFTRPLTQLASDIKAEFDSPLEKAGRAETLLRSKLGAWTAEQERIAEEKRRAAAKALAEEQRQAREKLEAEQKRLDSLKTAPAIEKAAARVEAAVAAVEEAEASAPIAVAQEKVAGFSVRDNWYAEFDDLGALVKAAAANPKLLMYLDFNSKQCNATVKAMKKNTDIPGVRACNRPTTVVR